MNLNKVRFDIHNGNWSFASAEIDKILNDQSVSARDHAHALFYQSWLLRAKGEQLTDFAYSVLQQLQLKHLNSNDDLIAALYYFRVGDWNFCKGNLNLAKEDLEKSITYFTSSNGLTSYEGAYAQYLLAITRRDLHGFADAIPYLKNLLDVLTTPELHRLRLKVFNELFFCYAFIKNSAEALITFEYLQKIKTNVLDKIDIGIAEAHMLILRRNFDRAREKLLNLAVEIKKTSINKARYDIGFHLAYLYAQRAEFKKAWMFLGKNADPIYKLQVFGIQLQSGDTSILADYKSMAEKSVCFYHLEQIANYHRKKSKKKYRLGHREINDNPKIKKLLSLVSESKGLSKECIAKNIFNDNFYEAHYHDPKIYYLVLEANALIPKEKLLVNRLGKYYLNPDIDVIFEVPLVATGLALKIILKTLRSLNPSLTPSQLARILVLPRQKIERALAE